MAYVYILKLCNGKYYIGSTGDIKERLANHNSGRSLYTRKYLPLQLVFSKELKSISEARRWELFIKKQKSHKFISNLLNGEVDLNG